MGAGQGESEAGHDLRRPLFPQHRVPPADFPFLSSSHGRFGAPDRDLAHQRTPFSLPPSHAQLQEHLRKCTVLLMQQLYVASFSASTFCPTFYAQLSEPVSAPQPTTQKAMKQLLYMLKQAEKLMPPSSFGMMRKALFTVRLGRGADS